MRFAVGSTSRPLPYSSFKLRVVLSLTLLGEGSRLLSSSAVLKPAGSFGSCFGANFLFTAITAKNIAHVMITSSMAAAMAIKTKLASMPHKTMLRTIVTMNVPRLISTSPSIPKRAIFDNRATGLFRRSRAIERGRRASRATETSFSSKPHFRQKF